MLVLTIVALLAGLALGGLVWRTQSPFGLKLAEYISAAGMLWTNALQMTVIPLIVSLLIGTVAAKRDLPNVGKVSGVTIATFLSLLILGVLFVLLVAPPIIARYTPDAAQVPTLSDPQALAQSNTPEKRSAAEDLMTTILPPNLVRAASNDDILPLVIFAILLGLAATRIPEAQRELLTTVLGAFTESILVLIGWILRLIPFGVFAIAFSKSATTGLTTLGILGAWVGLLSVMTIGFTVVLYIIAVTVGATQFRTFAKSVARAQVIGFASRSSIAALPALLSGAREHLRTSISLNDLVLPLAVASFRPNRSISSTTRLLFLAHIYGIQLRPMTVITFIVAAMLLSVTSPGLPSGGPVGTIPLYLAAGIPIEGIILLKSVDALPDSLMTVLNVTGDTTALTVVQRFTVQPSALDSLPAESPAGAPAVLTKE